MAPKAAGAWALHRATAERDLNLFVVYSSVTTAFGNPGQANYVAANALLEGLILHRRAAGLPGLAVCWGAISDAGYLTRNSELGQQLEDKLGAQSLTTAEALGELERLLTADLGRMTVARLDWRKLKGLLPALRTAAFTELTLGSGADAAGDAMDLQALVADMTPAEVKALLVEVLAEEVGHVLRLPADKVDPNKSVFDLGMDSLMAVELRTALEQRLGIDLPAMALGEGASITRLAERIREGLLGSDAPEPDGGDDNVVRAMADRHSEDIDADELREIIEEAGAQGPQRLLQNRTS
jgi:acyl carrier protein